MMLNLYSILLVQSPGQVLIQVVIGFLRQPLSRLAPETVHKEEFKSNDGYTTNLIESLWSQFKNWINNMHGLRRDAYDAYLDEFMYRYNYSGGNRNDCIDSFLKHLEDYQNSEEFQAKQ